MPVAIGIAFPALWPAIAILLILWAAVYIFQKPLVALLSKLPVVGTAIADAVGRAIGGLIDWAANWAAAMVRPLLELLSAPVIWLAEVVHAIVLTAEAIATELGRIASVAAGRIGDVAARLATLYWTVTNLSAIVAAAQAALAGLVTRVTTILTTTIPAAIAQAEAMARALVAAALATVAGQLAAAQAALRAWASAAIAVALAPLQAAYAALPAWVQAQIAAAVAVVAGALGVRVGGVEAGLGQVQGQVGTIATALTPLLALELVRVVPQVISRVDTMDRKCVTPMCNALTSQLDMFSALSTGVSMALLLSLVAEAVHDPVGTARGTAADAGGLVSLSNSLVGPSIGVRL